MAQISTSTQVPRVLAATRVFIGDPVANPPLLPLHDFLYSLAQHLDRHYLPYFLRNFGMVSRGCKKVVDIIFGSRGLLLPCVTEINDIIQHTLSRSLKDNTKNIYFISGPIATFATKSEWELSIFRSNNPTRFHGLSDAELTRKYESARQFVRNYVHPDGSGVLSKILQEFPNLNTIRFGGNRWRLGNARLREIHEEIAVVPFSQHTEPSLRNLFLALRRLEQKIHLNTIFFQQHTDFDYATFGNPYDGTSKHVGNIHVLDLSIGWGVCAKGQAKPEINVIHPILQKFTGLRHLTIFLQPEGRIWDLDHTGGAGPSKLSNVIGGNIWNCLSSICITGVSCSASEFYSVLDRHEPTLEFLGIGDVVLVTGSWQWIFNTLRHARNPRFIALRRIAIHEGVMGYFCKAIRYQKRALAYFGSYLLHVQTPWPFTELQNEPRNDGPDWAEIEQAEIDAYEDGEDTDEDFGEGDGDRESIDREPFDASDELFEYDSTTFEIILSGSSFEIRASSDQERFSLVKRVEKEKERYETICAGYRR
jgi:hypothetical protein